MTIRPTSKFLPNCPTDKACKIAVKLSLETHTLDRLIDLPISEMHQCRPDRLIKVLAGMYEDSRNGQARAGVPAKSGVSGEVVSIVPGSGAIASYSPRLDRAGNSVRASLAVEELIHGQRLHSIKRLLEAQN